MISNNKKNHCQIRQRTQKTHVYICEGSSNNCESRNRIITTASILGSHAEYAIWCPHFMLVL